MSNDSPWIKVWCQGGKADDHSYFTLVEPPEEIVLIPTAEHHSNWVRVEQLVELGDVHARPAGRAVRPRAHLLPQGERVKFETRRSEARDELREAVKDIEAEVQVSLDWLEQYQRSCALEEIEEPFADDAARETLEHRQREILKKVSAFQARLAFLVNVELFAGELRQNAEKPA